MPNSLKCRLKKFVHKGLLSEKDLSRLYTDNDVIEELEKIKKEINSEDVNCRYDEYAYSSGLQKAIELIDDCIEELKGEEQKIAYWIEREIEDTMRWKECSECHSEYPNMNGLKYCPNCGAKMEKLKGENKECPYFDYEVGTCRRSEV